MAVAATASLVRTGSSSRSRLLVAAAVAVTICGVAGYLQAGSGVLDALYDTLLLFTATYTQPSSAVHASPLLQLARFGALAVAFAAVASALVVVFRDQFDAFAARRARGHVVLCGLGDLGTRLALQLRSEDYGVVAVATQIDQLTVRRLRREGVRVIGADPQDPSVLRRAGIDRACHVVALDGADEANATIAALAADSRERTTDGRLACLAHIRDLALCERLRAMWLRERPVAPQVTVDFVNGNENAAQDLIAHQGEKLRHSEPLHVLMVDPSRFSVAFMLQLTRGRTAAHGTANVALTVVGVHAQGWCSEATDTWSELAAAVRVVTFNEEPSQRMLMDIGERARARMGLPVHLVAVCCADPDRCLLLALALAEQLPTVDIAVQADGGSGLVPMLATEVPTLHPVDTVASLLRPTVLLSDIYVTLARASHEDYLDRRQRIRGEALFSRPALRPWHQLSSGLKSSNIDQARFMVENLRLSGYGIERPGSGSAVIAFDPATTDELAQREHERWLGEHQRNHHADLQDHDSADPDLRPWDLLPEPRRELDRDVVRNYPRQAARAGYRIVGSTPAG